MAYHLLRNSEIQKGNQMNLNVMVYSRNNLKNLYENESVGTH